MKNILALIGLTMSISANAAAVDAIKGINMKRFILLLVLSALNFSAHGGVITYTMEGDLSCCSGGSDVNDLAGAHFVWISEFDSTDAPRSVDYETTFTTATYRAISSIIYISNRPSSSDIQRNVFSSNWSDPADFVTRNRFGSSINDSFWSVTSYFAAQESGLNHLEINENFTRFPVDFFPGSGPAPLPTDLSGTIGQQFSPWVSPNHGTRYYPVNVSFTVSQVPIPAAAWLFGSALLGLGMVKRRKV